MKNTEQKVVVVGAGLAGAECAWFLAERGVSVILLEKKRQERNPAQKTDLFAELVCTNSLKSLEITSAHGLLKQEMQCIGSLILRAALQTRVPAGDALAVDREKFSAYITEQLQNHPKIEIVDEIVVDPLKVKDKYQASAVVIATGPLTGEGLELWLQQHLGHKDCYFYDAIAPVVDADSLDYTKLYFKNRHQEDGETADYLNAPMNKEQYYAFIEELVKAEKVAAKNFEQEKYFESCLPIDVMAERGKDTARYSCMKPIGLAQDEQARPFAVVQLRKENLLGAAFNLVGFQTRLTYPEQKRVFRMIPGLEQAQFIHLGSVHRNTFLNSAKVLQRDFSSKLYPWLYFAGQITGVEGYTESAAMGQYVAIQLWKKMSGKLVQEFPLGLCMGALVNYVMTWERPSPSNINFGLLPMVELEKGKKYPDKKLHRKEVSIARAKHEIVHFLQDYLQ